MYLLELTISYVYAWLVPFGTSGFFNTTVNLGSMPEKPPLGNLGEPVIKRRNFLLPSKSSSVMNFNKFK
jgi:hypothetical protein